MSRCSNDAIVFAERAHLDPVSEKRIIFVVTLSCGAEIAGQQACSQNARFDEPESEPYVERGPRLPKQIEAGNRAG
jgi:hypothetical protein